MTLSSGGWIYCSDRGIRLVIRHDSPIHEKKGSVVLQSDISISVNLMGIMVLTFLVLHTKRSLDVAETTMYNRNRRVGVGQRGRSDEQLHPMR